MKKSKTIAQHILKMFGGSPKVNRYYNDGGDKIIDILSCTNVPQKGLQSCASIGLSDTPIGLTVDEKELRTEIVGVSDMRIKTFGNIIASAAFNIMDSHKCHLNYIVENVVNQYIKDTDMKHILLTNPFLWDQAHSINFDNICIAWLMVVPISDSEYDYAKKHGTDALEDKFEEKQIDIFNMFRKSII